MIDQEPNAPADTPPDHWTLRLAPRTRAMAQLARLDRPIGAWLLFWPCAWGVALAAAQNGGWPSPFLLALFGAGAVLMRGAGCTYNDIIDRHLDAHIARTKTRPLPSGRIGLRAAWRFLIAQSLAAFIVLLQFNAATIWLGLASLALIAIYPFMKRVTWWPQFFLGLAFNWGALMGFSAGDGAPQAASIALYIGGIFWTLGYDTIYAHQDREDDALVGIKSSARRLGQATHKAVSGFYALCLCGLGAAGLLAEIGVLFWSGLAIAALHFWRQIAALDIDDAAGCLRLFQSNRDFGLIVFCAILLGRT